MKRKLQALAALLLLGALKLPLEETATAHLRAARLLTPPLDLSLRENFSQMSFAAALGGLRSLIASITYLQAYQAWENINWGRVDSLFQLTTSLQPRHANYWDEASWHMAYNAASSYLHDETLNPAVRGKLHHEHIQRGIDILRAGLRVLPEEPRLWNSLAEIYERRVLDPRQAGDCYLQVMRYSRNPRFARFAGYQYALTSDPALWRQAYDLLKAAYDQKQRPPTLINTLKQLETRLGIPAQQRIPDAAVPVPASPGASGPVR